MLSEPQYAPFPTQLKECLQSRWWRLNNLYYIKDKAGKKIEFKPNWAQTEILKDLHTFNVILKARQLGITTLFAIYFLDMCLFNSYINAAIIADRQSNSKEIFSDKVKFAYDNLNPYIKAMFTARRDNANELRFDNGSVYRVGTSLRSGTLQFLHISEFGKICREFPYKANELVAGALNTVNTGQFITIESTAEGREGYFYEIVKEAEEKQLKGEKLGPMDFKLFFLPWWKHPDYRLQIEGKPMFNDYFTTYFNEIRLKGIDLTPEQMQWYVKKSEILGDDMKKEFPSTINEAFEVNAAGLYYATHISIARSNKRIAHIPFDATLKVHTAWDLGFHDTNTIIFFQLAGKEVHIIDYIEGTGKSLSEYIREVKRKDYVYGTHIAPHDIKIHEYSTGVSRYDTAASLGINFVVAPEISLADGIDCVRNTFPRLFFNNSDSVLSLVKHLENYTQQWDRSQGMWSGRPQHDEHSHAADALRYLCLGLNTCIDDGQSLTQEQATQLWRTYGKKI